MLVGSHRHTSADLAHWASLEKRDARWGMAPRAASLARRAMEDVERFVQRGPCYVGISWGKDSVVAADLALRACPSLPMVWIRMDPVENPDCAEVRDRFLSIHPGARYLEIPLRAIYLPEERAWKMDMGRGFVLAAKHFGNRYISGIRAAESVARRKRMSFYGVSSRLTCAPIGAWAGDDVFGYLALRGLPVHPAYACSHGGLLPRERIRVASLGGMRGTEFGRREWEACYYGAEMTSFFQHETMEAEISV